MSTPRSNRFGIANRRTDNTLRVLDQGAGVSALHNDLQLVGLIITDDELESGRFGTTTYRAVIRFQRGQELEQTGIVDKETRLALRGTAHPEDAREAEEQRARRRRSIRTLRSTTHLGTNSREFQIEDEGLAEELQGKKTAKLKQQLLELFEQPSEQVVDAVNNLTIDLTDVVDMPLKDLLFTRVVPSLMRDESIQSELFKIARRGIDTEDEAVSDVLGLEQDARNDDTLREFVNRARNAALGDIVSLDDDAIEALGDIDVSQNGDALFRLAEEGTLRETQRDELLFAADLTRLTDDNFDTVRTLIGDGIQTSRDLVNRDRSDWFQFIEANAIEPPQGDTPEVFATVLDKNVELAFPTAYALTRFTAPPPERTLERIDVLNRLPDRDGPLFTENGPREDFDLSALPESEAEEIRTDLADLGQFANRYVGLGIRSILNDRSLNVTRKRELIGRRQAALARAWNSRPELDLKLANFTPLADPTARAFSVELDEIEPSERPFVRSALMSIQRTLRLSDGYAEADSLMAAGLDDAVKIAELDDADELAERAGLARPVALRIRARAIETRTRMLHVIHGLEETTGHAPFLPATLHEANTPGVPGTLINVLQNLPGYSELFGPQNYCKCPHCRSIFGPAAYFVDLMRFIDKKISRRNFINPDLTDHPLYLRNRRPDLWTLPLTCENTNTLVRYIEIVNEVLEHYLESADPLDGDVWENLATSARSSFQQPFNLPHAGMLLYLEHLGVGLDEISSLFDEERQAATYTRLGISSQELTTLAAADPGAVRQRFAKPLPEDLSIHETHLLTKSANIDREMLGRLLNTAFVRGNVSATFDISTEDPDDLIGFVEYLHLDIDDDADTEASLRAFLDRLHRLVRLQRALGWTPEALQMAIDALGASLPTIPPDSDPERYGEALNSDMLTSLVDLKRLMARFGLSLSETLGLCDRIPDAAPNPDTDSLWVELFGDLEQLTVRHPGLGNTQPDETEVSRGFGILQGALQVSEPDLIILLQRDLPAHVIGSGFVSRDHLNRLYRSARLARVLDLSQQAFAALTNIVPNLTADVSARSRLTSIHDAIDILDAFDRLNLSFHDLLHYLDGTATAEQDIAHGSELVEQIHGTLRDTERLWLTPTTFSQIEGMTPESTRAVIRDLLDSQGLLIQPDDTRERYLLTDGAALAAQDPRLLEALSVEGGPLHDPGADDHSAPFLTEALRQQLIQHLPRRQTATAIANALNLSGDTLAALDRFFANSSPLDHDNIGLVNWLGTEDGSPSAILQAYVAGLIRLKALLVDTLDASDDTIRFIANRHALFEITPLSLNDAAPPSDGWQWKTLWRLASLSDILDSDEAETATVFRLLDGWNDAAFAETILPDLAQMFGVTTDQIQMLLAELPAGGEVFSALHRTKEAVRLTGRTGLDPVSLRQLTAETFAESSVAKDLALGAIRTKQPTEERWRTVNEKFEEKLDVLKRDALVDRILSRRELRFENTRNIYHFFLLDPEMDGCYRTSRIKNAISSCQLYMQRCLMGLENSVETDAHPAIQVKVKKGKKTRKEWKWRKSYRVWEANRKVFLYPENYMLPDLRDDRSHIFKAAESDLLQGNLDDSAIEKVFQRYLAEFVEVGNIKIVHTLYEKGDYIFFGRTQQEPYRYFMRSFNGKGNWEPWESIDIDIGAKTITAVTKNGKLYLFWTNVELDGDADKIRDAQPAIDPDELADDEIEQVPDLPHETLPITVSYAVRNEAGVWSSPQDFVYYSLLLWDGVDKIQLLFNRKQYRMLPLSDRIYVEFRHPSGEKKNSGIEQYIRLIHPVEGAVNRQNTLPIEWGLRQSLGFLREYDNKTIKRNGNQTHPLGSRIKLNNWAQFKTPGIRFEGNTHGLVTTTKEPRSSAAEVDYVINGKFEPIANKAVEDSKRILLFKGVDLSRVSLTAVQRKTSECTLQAGDLQYLIKLTGEPTVDLSDVDPNIIHSPFWYSIHQLMLAERKLVPLTTRYPKRLSDVFLTEGLDQLLSPEQQSKPELLAIQSGMSFEQLREVKPPDEDFAGGKRARALAQFSGVHGSYLWELHFHLPFQIAHTLNSIGKFEEAEGWYRYIFDPTTADSGSNAHWRFVVFRTLKQPKLRTILSDRAAIRKYKKDPFNPFAIARLRPSAFQKTIVMRYIDNLLDWGDELFRTDTRESNNEAMLLYIMAADLLGERPAESGECEMAEENFTFDDVQQRGEGSEFLIELENLVYFFVNMGVLFPVNTNDPTLDFASPILSDDDSSEPIEPPAVGSAFTMRANAASRLQPYAVIHERVTASLALNKNEEGNTTSSATSNITFQPDFPPDPDPPFEPTYDFVANDGDDADIDGPALESRQLGFCVPPNDTLLGYWNRVEDRLFKLRHCMNIEGVVRELPMWQPPIDPMLLVRAKAAGLELDDVLNLINQQPPHHRFEVLLERARRFTATAQQFGNQLLSALERKDESELTLLRSVHESTILNLVRRQKQDAITEAKENLRHLERAEETIQARLDHYDNLIDSGEHEYGMIYEEKTVVDEMEFAKDEQIKANKAERKAIHARERGPQWTVGTHMELGVKRDPKGTPKWGLHVTPPFVAQGSVTWGSANIEARYQGMANEHRDSSAKHSASSNMASNKAGHLRRFAEWRFQRSLAQKEILALTPQKLAADMRVALAEKDLETHDQQIDNSRELYEFAKDRFTNLGLYSYLSTTLSRLYREAYDMAFRISQTAERAYRFEVDEDNFFIKLDNWTASRAGLLAADRLLLQLQAMEAAFVERDRRRQEITLSCALSQFDPDALLRLRTSGRAEFTIPEWWFDLHYPGQYRRMLSAVRLTIPCVSGPYNNVAAKLTLIDSSIRTTASADDALVGVQIGRNTSISTSSAKSDPGVFELRFDGPKNPPFKGAGAVSSWVLELPSAHRMFDYATIADAILELSYTAEDDGLLQQAVEGTENTPGSIETALDNQFLRIISLRHEFPNAYHNLINMPDETGAVEILLNRARIFPHWYDNRNLEVNLETVMLEPKSGDLISMENLQGTASVTINGETATQWSMSDQPRSLPEVLFENSNLEFEDETTIVSIDISLPEAISVADILLRISI